MDAEFNRIRHDLYWKVWAGEDKFIRWVGYDDTNWWERVAPTDAFRVRRGHVTGRLFRLDPETNSVAVEMPA